MIIMEKKRKDSKNKMQISRGGVTNKGKNWKDIKIKKQIQRGGVTRPPSQFESYSLSASSKSYSGRSYSAPKPD